MYAILFIAIPLLFSAFTYLGGEKSKHIALVSSLITLALGIWTCITFGNNAASFTADYQWISQPNVHFAVSVNSLNIILLLLTSIATPLIILSAFENNYINKNSLFTLILLMQCALYGLFLANDGFLFYFFFEIALLPIYFIAAIWGGQNRIKVTFKFFLYTLFGSLFMLLAFIYLYYQTPGNHSAYLADWYNLKLSNNQQFYIFGGIFIAFAIKMPLFPFHTWQPDTYTESPAVGTMLMAGIMLKMGTYGLLKVLLPITPFVINNYAIYPIALGIVGIVYGSIIAIQQDNIKRLIAYSSFAHVGLMAAGIFAANKSGLQGSLLQMFAHGINVIGLFFIAEIIERRTKTLSLSSLGGITQNTPNFTVHFIIIMLGSVALPLTNGFVGEFLLLKGIFDYGFIWAILAGTTIILGAIYMLRLVQKSIFGPQNSITENFTDLTFTEKAVLFPISVMVIVFGLAPNLLLKLSEPAVDQLIQQILK